tara:strand:+ start:102 stop:287 length:186 start_codon:yes stop_codon:yes gene_type:complete
MIKLGGWLPMWCLDCDGQPDLGESSEGEGELEESGGAGGEDESSGGESEGSEEEDYGQQWM